MHFSSHDDSFRFKANAQRRINDRDLTRFLKETGAVSNKDCNCEQDLISTFKENHASLFAFHNNASEPLGIF